MQYPETESRAVSQKALRHDGWQSTQLSYWGCVRDHKVPPMTDWLHSLPNRSLTCAALHLSVTLAAVFQGF